MSVHTGNLEEVYQKKTDKEHVLDNPDTYTGSMDIVDIETFVYDEKENKIVNKKLNDVIMGLYKLFDEGIVNCRDHCVRMEQAMKLCQSNIIPLSYIDVSISDDGMITFVNDGNGIDIVEHPVHKIWIPEMIFYHLRTGTNYNKSEKKIVGGKNGFGSKLIFIWSEWGLIETVDHIRGLKYIQECSNNLDVKNKPIITKYKGKPYTKISFKPDYKRLKLHSGLTPGMLSLFKRRVYDIAAVTDKKIKVKWNSEQLSVKHFQQYVDMYIGNKSDTKRIYESFDDRWEYAVCLSPNGEFQQVSFVNGIFTSKGGKHVDHVLNQVINKIKAYILKKKKIEVKSTSIKEQLMLFLRCDIENPAFDSQTKDFMNTNINKFGSKCEPSDSFCEKIAKLGVMDTACDLTAVKTKKDVSKSDGCKTKSVRGIPKLIDANLAGGSESGQCTIIFCEGDSAKAGIVSGLSKEDRNYIGVYPLKGKLLNVRGETVKKIGENKEIIDIKKILGLETDKKYDSIEQLHKSLRYGKILFMTDQDLDGSHIKGLGINLFHNQWNSIIKLNVLGFMNTPILKAKKGKSEIVFYNDGEYELWKEQNENGKGWNVKYYKGLGTSTAKEFKEYFANKKIVTFTASEDTDDMIDLVFNKKRADDRKDWLNEYDRKSYLNTSKNLVSFSEFINKELKHYSKYDCDRNIAAIMDGLKTSQRKILFAAFKRNLTKEIKVAQFSGYVSEHSGYHHGEASLNGAIVNMAQDFVGSNNINLLLPNGQFGTRMTGGNDSASERYIFTELNPITRKIFSQQDDNILQKIYDDGNPVEPIYYAPIIPMILINGSKGIGTGFSTDILSYNPLQIINYLLEKLKNGLEDENFQIDPYFEGFKGSVQMIQTNSSNKYLIKGVYKRIEENKIQITELPIGSWTTNYKEFLENLIDGNSNKSKSYVKDYVDMSTEKNIDITVVFKSGILDKLETNVLEYNCTELEKYMKLYTTASFSNMHLFDSEDKLKLYKNPKEIINEYFVKRLELYEIRKQYLCDILEKELVILSNKAKYIQELLDGTIDLRKKNKEQITQLLNSKKYNIIDDDKDFKYLKKMPMDSVSEEEVTKIMNQKSDKEKEYKIIKEKSINKIWEEELIELKEIYIKYKESRVLSQNNELKKIKSKKKKDKLKLKLKKVEEF